jgi:hypothetical protein
MGNGSSSTNFEKTDNCEARQELFAKSADSQKGVVKWLEIDIERLGEMARH